MIRGFLGMYGWRYPRSLVYMLQSVEYRPGPYLAWYWRTRHFGALEHRRTLDNTRPARLLLGALRVGLLVQLAAAIGFIWMGAQGGDKRYLWGLAAVLVISAPVVWAHLVVVPLLLGRWLVVEPRERQQLRVVEAIFARHSGVKIAILGSYGKTSMKELLQTVLREGMKTAATPANKNVAVSQARFARGLDGDEAVLLLEYGEGRPGDIARFARLTHPTHAVITGLAPAHLDAYKTLDAAAQDIFAIDRFVEHSRIFVNGDSPETKVYAKQAYQTYDHTGVLGWRVKKAAVSLEGTSFELSKSGTVMRISTKLLGRHQVGPVALCAVLAHLMGMQPAAIETALKEVRPYEHRMQPYELHGARIIDDTYNGNIEGIRAGTALLAELPATRKIYVTPGLVDQGEVAPAIHEEIGQLIAAARPDITVLMRNSVTDFIQKGLADAGYDGEVQIQDDPLDFYENLGAVVAAGDVVLMQNDWTDNYR